MGEASSPKARFSTFTGVFTPSVLTILGIILFLRAGWVVGQAGLHGALLIVGLANAISLLTALSISAIATSMRVRTGGSYYLISRSLGVEIGGAIGIPLYLSQAISVAFYVIGFTESFLAVLPPELLVAHPHLPQVVATAGALLFGLLSYVGADVALRIQFLVLALLGLSLLSFFTGGWGHGHPGAAPAYTAGKSFWVVFAVFFPAVTGVEAGTGMSGDLADPGRSIPRGTLCAVLVTAAVYFAAVYWLGTHATTEQLLHDNLVMQSIARWPWLILAGVWAATLSSALGSILSAPRTLQALAHDGVVPRVLAAQLGSPTEPRVAVLLTTTIAVIVIWMGDLNFVAPVITMFFLNTYGMTNLSAGIERLVGNPSFRPQMRVPWQVSILGAMGCYGAMLLINPIATVVAVVVSYGVFFVLQRRAMRRTWGDVRSGIWLTVARDALLRVDPAQRHAKNWRPNLLVFTGQPHGREHLAEVADWLATGRGVVTFCQLIVGDPDELAGRGLQGTAERAIQQYIQARGMAAFAEASLVPEFHQGALTAAQAHGIGGLATNTVMMGWSQQLEGLQSQVRLMRSLVALGKSVLVLRYLSDRGWGDQRRIDVWWRGRGGNADLMMLLAHLVGQHRAWGAATIRLLRVVDRPEAQEQAREHLGSLLAAVRLVAEPVVLVRDEPGQRVQDIIARESTATDLTFLGLLHCQDGATEPYAAALQELSQAVGTAIFVRSAAEEGLLAKE